MKTNKKILLPVIFFVLFILTLSFFLVVRSSNAKTLEKQRLDVSEMDNKRSVLLAANDKDTKKGKTRLVGLSEERVEKDSKAFVKFMNDEDVLDKIKNKNYGAFVKASSTQNDLFTGTILEGNDGGKLKCEPKNTYVLSISGDRYTYLSECNITYKDKSAIETCAYTVNGQGKLFDITFYPMGNKE